MMTEFTRDYPIEGYEDCTDAEKAEIQRMLGDGFPPGSFWLYPTPAPRTPEQEREIRDLAAYASYDESRCD